MDKFEELGVKLALCFEFIKLILFLVGKGQPYFCKGWSPVNNKADVPCLLYRLADYKD